MSNMKRTFRRIVGFLSSSAIVLSIVFSSSFVSLASNEGKGSDDLKVDYHTKAEIASYIKSHPCDGAYSTKFDSTPQTTAPYSLGKVSSDTLNGACALLNTYRYIAGIPSNVTLSDSYNDYAQAATLVNAANKDMNHYPAKPSGMSDDMYNLGYKGAGSSNLAAGYSSLGYALANGWMSDADTGNRVMIGHRRWVLNPKMGQTGFGVTNRYYAMYSFDSTNSAGADYSNVAWPAQNTPVGYFASSDPWSISVGEAVEYAKVTLTCVNTGSVWAFEGYENSKSNTEAGFFNINNQGYGQPGCIIFCPKNGTKVEKGYTYTVSVTGTVAITDWVVDRVENGITYLKKGKVGEKPISLYYEVDFFDLKDYENQANNPTDNPSDNPSNNPSDNPSDNPSNNTQPDQNQVESFVERFYTQILDRPSEPAGLENWTVALMAGTRGGADVADEFIHSAEFQKKTMSDDEYITKLYHAFFNREPDAPGMASWQADLAAGKGRDFVLNGFLVSDEYKNLCANYGIKRDSTRTFVKRFYKIILGREDSQITAAELDNWQIALDAKAITGADMAREWINETPEFKKRTLTDVEYLNILYNVILKRDIDPSGLATWTNQLNSGKSRAEVLDMLLASDEFKDLCKEYGIDPGK